MTKKGFTLVEILVALFLSGLVIAGLVGLWVSATNFASSSRQELMWKNQMSVGARKMHKDVIEAFAVNGSQTGCTYGGTAFLTVFKNYSPSQDIKGCIIGAEGMKATTVYYCFRTDDGVGSIRREEGTSKCDAPLVDFSCSCSPESDIILNNVAAVPTVKQLDGSGAFEIQFKGLLEVGRNKRPVYIDYNKTFAAIGIGG